MAMDIGATLGEFGDRLISFADSFYTLVFPEFPQIGIVIIIVAVLTIIVDLVKKSPVLEAFKSGAALFLTLTVLAFFLHLGMRLIMMIQHHTL